MKKLKLAILLLISLITMLVYGNQKIGYHVDEVYSYGLANSEYLPFMHFGEIDYGVKDWMKEYGTGESLVDLAHNLVKDFRILKECGFRFKESVIYKDYLTAQENSADTRTTTWVSGQEYMNYVAVSESNKFNYASVYYNQRGDVHPPLYYIILHTICSVFQGIFSKWFALSINIVVLLLTLLMLYKMADRYLGGEAVALATVGIYGLSGAFMDTAVWLRMYALFALMVTICCYVHLKIAAEDFRLKGKNRRMLMLVVLGGFLTHYYFVLYAIGIAMVFVIWMLLQKRWKKAISYILTLAGTAAIGLCIWPFAVRHVFVGYRGREALDALAGAEFSFYTMKVMFGHVVEALFGENWWILIAGSCAVAGTVIWKIWRKRKGLITEMNLPLGKGLLVIVPIALYTLVAAQIVPLLAARYLMGTFPLWFLAAAASAAFVLREVSPAWKGKALPGWKNWSLALVGVLLFAVNNCYRELPDNLTHGWQETVKVRENTDCVYVLPDDDWNESAIDSTILAQCRKVGVVYYSNLDSLAQDYEYQDGDYVMVAIHKDMDIEEVLGRVKDVLGLDGLVQTQEQMGATAVRILLTR